MDSASPSAFEIGRIAALDSVKTAILSWLGIPASIIIGLVAILGYFGVTGLIGTTVEKQVQTQIEHETKSLQDKTQVAFAEFFTKIGEANASQQAIVKLLDKTNADLAQTQGIESQLNAKIAETQKQNDALQRAVAETTDQKERLQNAIRDLNIAAFVVKLRYDFYHIHDFSVKAHIDFDTPLPAEALRFAQGAEMNIDSVVYADTGANSAGPKPMEREVAELSATDRTTLTDNNTVTGINISYNLFSIYEDRIFSHRIEELANVNRIWMRFDAATGSEDQLKLMMSRIKNVDVAILINWRPVWKFSVPKEQLEAAPETRGDEDIEMRYSYSFEPLKDKIVPKYEALFDE